MGSNSRTLEVIIAGDAKGAQDAFNELGRGADGFGQKWAA